MRINKDRKTVDIEERDVEYVLQSYTRLYLFNMRNEEPEKIIFPMFDKIPHPLIKGKFIPIEYIPSTSPIAIEIQEDGDNIPRASVESEAKADEQEKAYDKTKDEIKKIENEAAKATEEAAAQGVNPDEEEARIAAQPVSAARAAFAPEPTKILQSRIAKEPPGGALPPGTPSDYGPRRDAADSKIIKQAMARDKDISEEDEAHERPAEEIVKRAKKKGI